MHIAHWPSTTYGTHFSPRSTVHDPPQCRLTGQLLALSAWRPVEGSSGRLSWIDITLDRQGPPPNQQRSLPDSAAPHRGPPPNQQRSLPDSAAPHRGPLPNQQRSLPDSAAPHRGPLPNQQRSLPDSAAPHRGPLPNQQRSLPDNAAPHRGPPPNQQRSLPDSAAPHLSGHQLNVPVLRSVTEASSVAGTRLDGGSLRGGPGSGVLSCDGDGGIRVGASGGRAGLGSHTVGRRSGPTVMSLSCYCQRQGPGV